MKGTREKQMNKEITKFIAMFLIWSMILTSNAMVVFADSVDNSIIDTTAETTILDSTEEETILNDVIETTLTNENKDNVGASEDDSVGASSVSPLEDTSNNKTENDNHSIADDNSIEPTELSPDNYYENNVKGTDYAEEPEEDPTKNNDEDSVGAKFTSPFEDTSTNETKNENLIEDSSSNENLTDNSSSEDNVVASEENVVPSEDNVGAKLTSPFEDTSTNEIESENLDLATISEIQILTDEEDISTTSETNFISEPLVATDSEIEENIATYSEIKDNIATESEITGNIATTSDINLATDSNIKVATNSIIIATDSEIATKSELPLFGASPVESYIWFGLYPQNDTTGTESEPIKWRVLSQNGSEALLISEKLLDNVSYNNEKVDVTWETCSSRAWLNNSNDGFYGKAFNSNLKSGIKQKTISNPNNVRFNTNGGNATSDKVFYLSQQEAGSFFSSDNDRKAKATSYASQVDNQGRTMYLNNGYGYWWLRSPGLFSDWAEFIKDNGYIDRDNPEDYYKGQYVNGAVHGIRPAMYIDLTSNIFKSSDNSVTWDKSSGWSFKTTSALWDSYDKYQGGQTLPVYNNINLPKGKELKGWYINDDESTVYTEIPVDQTGDIKLSPFLENKKYNITWNLNGGEWDGDEGATEYTYSKGYRLPTNIKPLVGRVFDHWEIGGQAATTIKRTETGNKTVVAVYRNLDYNITWVVNGATLDDGSDFQTTYPTYTYGTGLTLPTNITMPAGKTFDHWTINGLTNTQISNTTYGDVTVILVDANQSANTHPINFDHKTGTDEEWNFPTGYPAPTEYTEGVPIPLPTNITPNNPGKEFDHWEVDGQPTNEIPGTITNDVDVSPVFRNKRFNIIYDLDGGSWDGTEGENTYEYSIGYILPTNIKAPETKDFDHWEIGNTTVTEILTTDTGDKTVKAKYRNATYNINWVVNGATLDDGSDFQTTYPTYTYGTAWTIPINITMPAGETFDHWTIDGITQTQISNTSKGDITITLISATQTTNTHTIIWDHKTGTDDEWTFTGWTEPTDFVEGVPIPLPGGDKVTPTNEGMEFDHWEVDGVITNEIPGTKTADINIVPVFKNRTFNITYNLGQGAWNGVAGASTYTYGTTYTIPTNVIPPVGKTFNCWSIGGTNITGITATDSGDKVISAKYTNITYNITWVLNNATVTGTFDTYTYGTAINLPTSADITEEAGKTFDYWLINGIEATSITNTTHGDLTITLVYQGVNTYPIVKELNGGEEMPGFVIPSEYVEGTEVILPTARDMMAPVDMELDYFLVNGVRALNIPSNSTGEVRVEAIYKDEPLTPTPTPAPTPNPTPYRPSGGNSGGNSGGSPTPGSYDANGRLVPGIDGNATYVNVRDNAGHMGYGRWLKIPNTTIWYFEIGAVGSLPTDKIIKNQIINKILLQYSSNGIVSGQYQPDTKSHTTSLLMDGWYNLGWKGREEWYHFDKNGVMQLGWYQDKDGKIYYLEEDIASNWYGRRVTGSKTINGITYNFNQDGVLVQ